MPVVAVFDLDDTLISEFKYSLSGFAAVQKWINVHYDPSYMISSSTIYQHLRQNKSLISTICTDLNLSARIKDSLLWVYRLHLPSLLLEPGVPELLQGISHLGISTSIITDGRSSSQRQKIRSIGLDSWPSFISEETGYTKPSRYNFELVHAHFPDCQYVYIADNPKKDFLAPRSMGWTTLGALWVSPRIHPIPSNLPQSYLPNEWVSHPLQILDFLQQLL